MVMMMRRRKEKKGDRCKKRRVQCNLQGRKGKGARERLRRRAKVISFQKYKFIRQIQKTKYKMQSAG